MSPSSTSSSEPATSGTAPDGLIFVTDAAVRGVGRKVMASIIVGLFVLVSTGTAIVDLASPVPLPKIVGDEAKREDERREAARGWTGFLDGSMAALYEHDFRLASRVRSKVVPPYALALYRWLGETKGEAVVGWDGWIFLRDRIAPRPESRAELVGSSVAILSGMERWLAGSGIRLANVPVPRKAVVHADRLPRGQDPDAALEDDLTQALAARGTPAVDLLAAFRAHAGQQAYHKVDSHWNDQGMAIAADAATRFILLQKPDAELKTRIGKIDQRPEPGDVYKMIGLETEGDAKVDVGRFDVLEVLQKSNGRVAPQNPAKDPSRVSLAGTSFSATTRFVRYLSHFVGEPVFNGGVRAIGPVEPLRRLLETAHQKNRIPKVVLWEIPAHNLFCTPVPLVGAGRVFAENAPANLVPLDAPSFGEAAWVPRGSLAVGSYALTTAAVRGTLAPGRLVHAGDGTVAVRFRGDVSSGTVEVVVENDDVTLRSEWNPGEPDCVVPILSWQPVATVSVAIRAAKGRAQLDLQGIDLVCDLDLDRHRTAKVAPPVASAGGFEQVATLHAPVKVARFAVARVVLEGGAALPGGLVCEARCAEGTTTTLTVPTLRAGALPAGPVTILVPLNAIEGRDLVSIAVRAAGAPPARLIIAADYVPKAGPSATTTRPSSRPSSRPTSRPASRPPPKKPAGKGK